MSAAANGFENTDRAKTCDIAGVFGHVKTDTYMTLSSQVIDLIRFDVVNHIHQTFNGRNVAIMQKEVHWCTIFMRIVIQVVNSAGIKGAGTADDTVNFISL